jgi:shikimate kinase / 3-dehydroquinate synthase
MSGSILYLYGPPGCGKSTIGQLLARDLALEFFDLDAEIEQDAGKAISDIFAAEGEAGFRRRESEMLKKLSSRASGVIALGGGTLLSDANRAVAEGTGQVVVFDAPLHTIHSRISAAPDKRPLLAGELTAKLENLLAARKEHYQSFSHHVGTEKLNPEQATWQVQVQAGLFHVTGMPGGAGQAGNYDVRVRPGGLREIGRELMTRHYSGPIALVTDDHVGPLYTDTVLQSLRESGFTAEVIQIPAGEEFKTIQTIELLWNFFLANQLDRSSTVVSLGGGVVSDMAGFAAATYLRGIRWVGLPTTVLSMADASLGGKTGADLPTGKNLIGAFHAPSMVLADPEVLSSLPERELRGGFAEIVKHGLISDPVLFEACKGLAGLTVDEIRQKPLTAIIRRAMAVKIRVIEQDPFEKGIRATLNAGHTVGHALELTSNFALSHGEAVSIGLVVETRMAEERGRAKAGLANDVSGVLAGLGLPVTVPAGMDKEKVETALFRDKKRAGSGVKFALATAVGHSEFGVNYSLDDLRSSHAFRACFERS